MAKKQMKEAEEGMHDDTDWTVWLSCEREEQEKEKQA